MAPVALEVDRQHIRIACSAWQAFCAKTPERWADLLKDDVAGLPCLRTTILQMLEQPRLVLDYSRAPDDAAVLDYWELGKILDMLSREPEPVLLGPQEGPFDIALHMNRDRLLSYKCSRLVLSELGHRLAEGKADLAQHTRVDRWWGGTKITNDHFWRWDRIAQVLLSPS